MNLRAAGLITTLIAGFLALGAGPAGADAACSIVEQVTSTTSSSGIQEPAVDADGDRIAFVSTRDLAGDNADLNGEIFLADRTADTFTQITDTLGGGVNREPEISDDGTKVVFRSLADLAGDNADGSAEIFLFDTSGSTFAQLTDDPTDTFFSSAPDISGDGTDVAFVSEANFAGGNADATDEVFLVNTSGAPVFMQLTSTVAGQGTDNPSVNQTGSRIAFASDGNLVPATGNADGNTEIFVVDAAGPTTVQLTVSGAAASNSEPQLSENGARVIFQSTANLAGANADANNEIFRRIITSATHTQLTDTTAAGNDDATTDETGSRVVLRSASTDHPRNADGSNEVLVTDVGVGDPNPVTASPAGIDSQSPVLADDGMTVVLTSEANPLGTNADGNTELFVARCGSITPTFTDVPTSNSFFGQIEWMSELGIANGFPGPTYRPADPVNRQQMANFMYNLAGQPAFVPPGTPTFSDVPLSNPFYLQIEWMNAEGIANGFPGGLYKPLDAVKRQQMANFMYNLAGQPLFSPPGSPTFTDVPVSNFFYVQIEWMFDEGIANGFPGPTFKPLDAVKRQQMANFMHNFAVSPGVDLS